MESSHLIIFSTSGKFITKFNVLGCISLSETLFWTGARGRIPITLSRSFFFIPPWLRMLLCSTVIYPHLLLSPSHFQNSLSTFSIERVNGIPLWDFCASDFQRALKTVIIAELFIIMTISPGWLRHNTSDKPEKCSSTIVRP